MKSKDPSMRLEILLYVRMYEWKKLLILIDMILSWKEASLSF
jgi:hypothetical protein